MSARMVRTPAPKRRIDTWPPATVNPRRKLYADAVLACEGARGSIAALAHNAQSLAGLHLDEQDQALADAVAALVHAHQDLEAALNRRGRPDWTRRADTWEG